jgi:hypothetical protein
MGLAASVPSRPSRFIPGSLPVRRALAVLAALVPLVLLTTPATAGPVGPAMAPVPASGNTAESATAASTPPPTSGPHCTLAAGADRPLHCFATFRAAVAFGTGGRVRDAPASATAAAHDPAFAAAVTAAGTAPSTTPAASILVGTEFADANFTGGTLSLFAPGRCDNSSDADFRFGSLPAGWNDRITSFRSFSNCAQQLFRSVNFAGGSLTLIISSLANVGAAANDQASSITFN